VALYQLS